MSGALSQSLERLSQSLERVLVLYSINKPTLEEPRSVCGDLSQLNEGESDAEDDMDSKYDARIAG